MNERIRTSWVPAMVGVPPDYAEEMALIAISRHQRTVLELEEILDSGSHAFPFEKESQ